MGETIRMKFRRSEEKEDSLKIAEKLASLYDIDPYTVEQLSDVVRAGAKAGELSMEKEGNTKAVVNLEKWFTHRIKQNTIALDWEDYQKALGNGLRILLNADLMKADMGTARQREFGQHWTDLIRGYLGEIAFEQFLSNRFDIKVDLKQTGTEGGAEEHIPTDVTHIQTGSGDWRKVHNTISIKTSKLRSMWLPLFANQVKHSKAHALVKLGIPLEHLVIGMKESRSLTKFLSEVPDDQIGNILESIPDYDSIPVYLPGYIWRSDLKTGELQQHRANKYIHIRGGAGKIPANVPSGYSSFKTEGINDPEEDYLAATGSLRWETREWRDLIAKL